MIDQINYVNVVGKIIASHENIHILELVDNVFVAVDVITLYRDRKLMQRDLKVGMVIEIIGRLTNSANVHAEGITVLIDEDGNTPKNVIHFGGKKRV